MTTKTKGQNTMTKIKENMAIFFGIVFIMSMVGATGAVEADNYLVGFVMKNCFIFVFNVTVRLSNSSRITEHGSGWFSFKSKKWIYQFVCLYYSYTDPTA